MDLIELNFSRAGTRLTALRETAETLQARAQMFSRRLFDLELERTALAGELAARARQAARAKNHSAAATVPSPPANYDAALFADMLTRQQAIQRAPLVDVAQADVPDPELLRLDRQIAGEEVARAKLLARSNPAVAIAASGEQWLRARHAMPSPSPFLVAPDRELADATLDELRCMLPILAEQTRAVEQAPLPRREAVAKLVQTINEAMTQPGLSLDSFIDAGRPGVLTGAAWPVPSNAAWTMLAQLWPDTVRADAERRLDALYARLPRSGPGAPVPLAERAKLLDEIEARRRSVELAEEQLIRASEAVDADSGPVRRQDARAAFVLATLENVR